MPRREEALGPEGTIGERVLKAETACCLRVHTFSGAEARLSVGYSAPPGPLRVVNLTLYLLPGSRSLSEQTRRRGASRG